MGTMGTFGLNIHMDHSNVLEQQLQPEHYRLSYSDEAMGMNFAPTEAWQTVQQQDLYTFFSPQQQY